MPLILGPIIVTAAGLIDSYSTQQLITGLIKGKHTGSPRLSPGAIDQAAVQIQKLVAQGRQPYVGTDPETGNLVVGSRDQDIALLVRERNARLAATPSAQDLRDAGFYEAVERARRSPVIATPSPGTVMAPIATHDVVARPGPVGGVVRGSAARSARGGPCAGATSAFQRIRCNLGGTA